MMANFNVTQAAEPNIPVHCYGHGQVLQSYEFQDNKKEIGVLYPPQK